MKHGWWLLVTILAGVFPATSVMAQQYGGHPGSWHGGGGWSHMLFGGLTMVLFWGGVIVVIVLLVRWLGAGQGAPPTAPQRPKAIEVLEERYARGEIDREEFEQRKRDLSSD